MYEDMSFEVVSQWTVDDFFNGGVGTLEVPLAT